MPMTSLPVGEEALAEMRADEAGAAGDQDARHAVRLTPVRTGVRPIGK